MERITCDVAIIGAGTAGLTAERAASGEGATTCMIEAGPGGTTCARVGCMPSKLLISAADAAHAAAGAATFGVHPENVRIDGRQVMSRVREHRDRFVAGVFRGIEKNPPTHFVTGQARFLDEGTLMVGDATRVEARAVVIAVGSRPSIPEPLRHLGPRLLTSETVFELEDLPRSVAVIGAGPLGLELAQALHRLGVRTTLLDRGKRLGGLTDETVNEVAKAVFAEELDLRLGVDVGAEVAGEEVRVTWEGASAGEGMFDRVLVAAGRRPPLDDLDLGKAGLRLDENGTLLFDSRTLRCGDSAIYIAGDANHDRPLLHEAALEGKIAGRNAARHPAAEPGDRPVALAIVFTDPQIASVGRIPDAADLASGSIDFTDQGRAKVMGANRGVLRLYGSRATGTLEGAQMACPGGEHFAHLIAWAVEAGIPPKALIELPYYHPTLEEGLRTAFRDLCRAMHIAPPMESLEYGPGG